MGKLFLRITDDAAKIIFKQIRVLRMSLVTK